MNVFDYIRDIHIHMDRYGETGWKFSVNFINALTDEQITWRLRTNPAGDGLWAYCASGSWYSDGSSVMEYKQTHGTCQFWLPTDRKQAYDKIRYWVVKENTPSILTAGA